LNIENSQKNKGNLPKITLIIVGITVLSIIGFVIFIKVFKKKDNNDNTEDYSYYHDKMDKYSKSNEAIIDMSIDHPSPPLPPEKDISSMNISSPNATNPDNNYIQMDQVPPLNPSNASNSFTLINKIKKNDFSAQNTVNKYQNKSINNIDENGWTALHWASYCGRESQVRMLIDNKAKLSIKTKNGLKNHPEYANKTAKEIAKLRNNNECAKMIFRCQIKRGIKSTFKAIINTIIPITGNIPK